MNINQVGQADSFKLIKNTNLNQQSFSDSLNKILSDDGKQGTFGNVVIGGGLLGGGNSGRGGLIDMILTPNGASNMEESPIFSTSFGNALGRRTNQQALISMQKSMESEEL